MLRSILRQQRNNLMVVIAHYKQTLVVKYCNTSLGIGEEDAYQLA